MSGETEAQESGWTVDTLRYHFDQQFRDLRLLLDERYQTQTRAIDAALQAQQTAMHTAFQASEAALEQRASTLDREFHEHLEQVRHENALAFLNSDKAIARAFEASDRAISKAEVANEKRFESVNEFRAQLTDQTASFLPRREYDTAHQALEQQVSELRDRLNRSDGKGSGYVSGWGFLVGGIGLLASVVALVLVVVHR